MMDKPKLRAADLITSILLILFGIWMLTETLKMPMTDSFGGVMNVWYVSPALFPFIISGGVILLAINIFLHALREGGVAALKAIIKERRGGISETTIRFAAILLPLFSLVFMNITRIDFFLSIVLFLLFFITVFYIDDMDFLKRCFVLYTAMMALILVLFATGAANAMMSVFLYAMDVVALLLIIILGVYMYLSVGKDRRGKFAHGLTMSLVAPLLLVPAFKFMLRVPLPKEGGIVELMSLLFFSLR